MLTIKRRLQILWEVMTARSGHKHPAFEKQLSTFQRGYRAGMHDKELELIDRIRRTENTLQQYARYANKEAMQRDIRLIGDGSA